MSDLHEFLVGTTSLSDNNTIHKLCYDEGSEKLTCTQIWEHSKGELWDLAPCPWDPSLLFTVYNTGAAFGATLWRIDMKDGGSAKQNNGSATALSSASSMASPLALDEAASFANKGNTRIRSVLWDRGVPLGQAPSTARAVVLMEHSVSLVELRDGGSAFVALGENDAIQEKQGASVATTSISSGSWDPHHPSNVAICEGEAVNILDVRASFKPSYRLPHAHLGSTISCDFNPNKPYTLVTGGEDSMIRFWDVRKAGKPLRILSGHSHWVSNVRYNPFHDQLLLSSGTDGIVNLWRVGSISSAPLLELLDNPHLLDDDEDDGTRAEGGEVNDNDDKTAEQSGLPSSLSSPIETTKEVEDAVIDSFLYVDSDAREVSNDAHLGGLHSGRSEGRGGRGLSGDVADPVYGLAWSQTDAWIFASLSYQGTSLVLFLLENRHCADCLSFKLCSSTDRCFLDWLRPRSGEIPHIAVGHLMDADNNFIDKNLILHYNASFTVPLLDVVVTFGSC